jgi:hypothetical protein
MQVSVLFTNLKTRCGAGEAEIEVQAREGAVWLQAEIDAYGLKT